MKKKQFLLLGLSLVALITAVLVGTTAAYASYNPDDEMYYGGSGQQWYLFKADPLADYSYDSTGTAFHDYMMQRAVVPGEAGSLYDGNATFAFNNGDTLTFFADEKANTLVTFPTGTWTLNLQKVKSDQYWGNSVTAKVGYFDGTNYTWFGDFSLDSTNKNGLIDVYTVYLSSDGVPLGDTLVVQIHNDGVDQLIKQSSGSNLFSPVTDPGYPLPEIAAGILLGGGLIGLISVIYIQKKKSSVTA
jgi:hypothetical protein